MPEYDDFDWSEPPGPEEAKPNRYKEMWDQVKRKSPGAVASALVDVARSPDTYRHFDVIWIFLVAMGWVEGHEMGLQPYRGHHPLDPQSGASDQTLARLLGADARKEAARVHEEFRMNLRAKVAEAEELMPPAAALAADLSLELVRAFEQLALGEYDAARARRRDAVARWNKHCDRQPPERFNLPRLCEHCGKPLLFVAKERLEGGRVAPPKVHGACKKAFRSASKRSK